MTLTVTNSHLGKYAFYNCTGLETATLKNVDTIGQYAFYNCTGLETVNLEGIDTIDQYAFWYCSNLETVTGLENVKTRIGGFAFYGCENLKNLSVAALTKMGYNGSVEMMERMEAILAGKFKLDSAAEIVKLEADEDGWNGSGVGQSANWDQYDNGTQLVEQVRWQETANSVDAEVQVDAYYTAQQQMDYIFVADLSASMAQLGNAEDSNARFYDMQSKLLDMTGQLLDSEGYDCRVAIVTFGGLFNSKETCETLGFTNDANEVESHIKSLEPLNENTDYGLGLGAALKVVQGQTSGRNTVVVFLSDGYPTVNNHNDGHGTRAAAAIKALNVPIYGVLHSPTAASRDTAMEIMNEVCNNVYESTDTQSFGEAMNKAFTSVYTTNTVTIPVSADFENVRNLTVSASAGLATYNPGTHTITWDVTGMPFTKHTLTYRMTLTGENAQKTGEQSFSVNGGNVTFGGASGASVDVSAVKLTRTVYTVTYTDGVADSEIFADQAIKVLAGRATPAFDGTPTRDGYTFAGWSPAVSDTVAGDVTYTAQWTVNGTSGSSGGGSDPTPRPTPAPTPTPAPVPETPTTPAPVPEAPGEPESEIPDADVPLNDSPDVELPEEDLPLAAMPGEELIELPEEEIPLAEVPKTGDNSGAWGVMALLAACGLAGLATTKKRKNLKEEEG